MRISHRHRFVFFASPKTGSTTVRRLLDPFTDVQPMRNSLECTPENPFYPHMPPAEAAQWFRRFGWDFDGYAKFVFVRNPWSRLVSLYEHIRREGGPVAPFGEWVFSLDPAGNGDGPQFAPWRRYGAASIEHFARGPGGGLLIDKVLRLEDIDRDLLPYLRRLGLPFGRREEIVPHNRRGPEADRARYYTAETADHVARLYRYDIVHYGYSFEDLTRTG